MAGQKETMKQELREQLAQAREGISPRNQDAEQVNAEDLYDADTELMHGESYLPGEQIDKKHLYMIAGAGLVGLAAAHLLFSKRKKGFGDLDRDSIKKLDQFVQDRYDVKPKRSMLGNLFSYASKAAFAVATPKLKDYVQSSLVDAVKTPK